MKKTWVLTLSLGLNVLLVAAVAGHLLRAGFPPLPPPQALLKNVAPEKAAALEPQLTASLNAHKARIDAVLANADTAMTVMKGDPFDERAFRQAMAALDASHRAVHDGLVEALVLMGTTLNADERARFVDELRRYAPRPR